MAPFAGSGFSSTDLMRGHGLPVGLTVPSIQLAHALKLLGGDTQHTAPGSEHHFGSPGRAGTDRAQGDRHHGNAAEARRLIADALASLAGSAGLSIPMGALAKAPEAETETETVDLELEAVFVEFDLACEAWHALPESVEMWTPSADVDRYLAAEEAVLNLADGSPGVLGRQASLLLDLTDEIADQLGPSTANAIANIAQGLLLRLRP
ncbi:MAG: hypothetical protein P1U88_16550 [Thalassobaculaceae bacterium]|nr:hypothetical protein [Thalassobaculaceae bacterium]